MGSVEAVVFDLDGTLVDTSEFISQAYEHALELHGHPRRSREEIASQVGRKLEECYAFLAPDANLGLLIDAHRRFQAANTFLIQPFTYASTLLEIIHAQGRKLALFTSRKNILPSLKITGINTGLFDLIVDGSMVEKGKPDPEGIERILGELTLHSSQVIMVGDAAVDIEAGKQAQLRATVGITHGFGTFQELTAAHPSYIIDSLTTLPALITRIENEL